MDHTNTAPAVVIIIYRHKNTLQLIDSAQLMSVLYMICKSL